MDMSSSVAQLFVRAKVPYLPFENDNDVFIINKILGTQYTLAELVRKVAENPHCYLGGSYIYIHKGTEFKTLSNHIMDLENKCKSYPLLGNIKLFYRWYHWIKPSDETFILFAFVLKICAIAFSILGFIADFFIFLLCAPPNIPIAIANYVRSNFFLKKDLHELRTLYFQIEEELIANSEKLAENQEDSRIFPSDRRSSPGSDGRGLGDMSLSVSRFMTENRLDGSQLRSLLDQMEEQERLQQERHQTREEHKEEMHSKTSVSSEDDEPPPPRASLLDVAELGSSQGTTSPHPPPHSPPPQRRSVEQSFVMVRGEEDEPQTPEQSSFFFLIQEILRIVGPLEGSRRPNLSQILYQLNQEFDGKDETHPIFKTFHIKLAIMLVLQNSSSYQSEKARFDLWRKNIYQQWQSKINNLYLVIHKFLIAFDPRYAQDFYLYLNSRAIVSALMRDVTDPQIITRIFQYLSDLLKPSVDYEFRFIFLDEGFERERLRKRISFRLNIYIMLDKEDSVSYDSSSEVALFFTQKDDPHPLKVTYKWAFPEEKEEGDE